MNHRKFEKKNIKEKQIQDKTKRFFFSFILFALFVIK
jgi:hypothetical protein